MFKLRLIGGVFLLLGINLLAQQNPCVSESWPIPFPVHLWGESGFPTWDANENGVLQIDDMGLKLQKAFRQDEVCRGFEMQHHGVDEYFATGLAWGDYNLDGWMDVYVTDSNGPNQLLMNQDGFLAESPLNSFVGLELETSAGAIWADLDNDSYPDLIVLNWGQPTYFHNDAGIVFQDWSTHLGVTTTAQGESATAGDFNGDGFLDLYLVYWGESIDRDDILLLNDGDGTFSNVTNLLLEQGIAGPGFAATFLDFDLDQDLDLYVVNDKNYGNVLWRNDGAGCGGWCFTDVSIPSNANTAVYGMGLATGDYDNDGDLDFFFTNIGPMKLLENQAAQGSPVFLDVSQQAGVDFSGVGWGAAFFDFDHDGWLDLFLAIMDSTGVRSNQMFRNNGDGTFSNMTDQGGAASLFNSLSLAYADVNRDGWLDFAVGNMDGPYELFMNQGQFGTNNSFIQFELIGAPPIDMDAVGAKIELSLSDGRSLFQAVKIGSSIGSCNMKALHFGLGAATVNQATITWPNGDQVQLISPAINQTHNLTFNPGP